MSSPDYSQAVKDIIDGLGDSPTPDAIYHAVRSYSVDHVVAAAAAAAKAGGGGGGGSQPVGCMLEAFPLDVHDVALNPCKWTALFDNAKDFTTLLAIPAGIGLTFAFDGSDATITTTEAGVWSFSLGFITPAQDATWVGMVVLDSNIYGQSPPITADFIVPQGGACVSETLKVSAGYSFAPYVGTVAAATADPFNADVYLNIVRFA